MLSRAKLHILIDGLSARVGGGVTYLRNILPALRRVGGDAEYSVLLSPRYQGQLLAELPAGVCPVLLDVPAEPLAYRWLRLQTVLRKIIRRHGVELFFAPADGAYVPLPVPFVMLIRNLSIYASPPHSGVPWGKHLVYRAVRQPLMRGSMRVADRVLFVSEAARTEILTRMPIPSSKTEVVHHGVHPVFRGNKDAEASGSRYILSVSTISPHKNYELLLSAFNRLVRVRADMDVRLLIAGKCEDPATMRKLTEILRSEGLQERVEFLGQVDHAQLHGIYKGASLFVFPSRLETFGNPLVEAMSSGVPVLASDLPVCREVCGDAAVYFDPADVAALAGEMEHLLSDRERQRALVHSGFKQANRFTWDAAAMKLTRVFRSLATSQ